MASPSGGLVHQVPDDMATLLGQQPRVAELWERLSPIARNELLCWIEDAKQEKTRVKRIQRAIEELLDGKKRPCCWSGCIHRTDKAPGKWQQAVLIDSKPRTRGRRVSAGKT